jgi:hypothetical protein
VLEVRVEALHPLLKRLHSRQEVQLLRHLLRVALDRKEALEVRNKVRPLLVELNRPRLARKGETPLRRVRLANQVQVQVKNRKLHRVLQGTHSVKVRDSRALKGLRSPPQAEQEKAPDRVRQKPLLVRSLVFPRQASPP